MLAHFMVQDTEKLVGFLLAVTGLQLAAILHGYVGSEIKKKKTSLFFSTPKRIIGIPVTPVFASFHYLAASAPR
jgi:hypothetical protein